jgi:hypothetical protein
MASVHQKQPPPNVANLSSGFAFIGFLTFSLFITDSPAENTHKPIATTIAFAMSDLNAFTSPPS